MIQTFVALTALIQAIFLGGRLAGFILANSTLSHVLSAAMPAKKTTNATLQPLETFPTRNRTYPTIRLTSAQTTFTVGADNPFHVRRANRVGNPHAYMLSTN